MADIKLIVDVDGQREVVKLNAELNKTEPAARKAGRGLDKAARSADNFSKKSNGVRKNTNRMNATIQNVGFQVGDLAVQLQSGQNALTAFSQQGAQLAGLLPGVAGAIAGVGIVAGVQFLKSTGLANDALEKMAEFFLNAEGAAKRFQESISDLSSVSSRLARLDENASPILRDYLEFSQSRGILKTAEDITTALDKQGVSLAESIALLQAYNRVINGETDPGLSYVADPQNRNRIISRRTARGNLGSQTELVSAMMKTSPLLDPLRDLDFGNKGAVERALFNVTRVLTNFRSEAEVAGYDLEELERVAAGLAEQFTALDSAVDSTEKTTIKAQEAFDRAYNSFLDTTQILSDQEKLERQARDIIDVLRERLAVDGEISEADALYMEQFRKHLQERLEGYLEEQQTIKDLEEQKKAVETQSNKMAKSITDGFRDIIGGTKSAAEAFRDMALKIIDQILDIMIYQPMIRNISNALMGPMGGLMGYSPGGGGTYGGSGGILQSIIPYAKGGVVNGPTYFGHSGGLGLMGEAGPEAILPLQRGPGGKLGVAGGGGVNITQNFNLSANGDESVKRIIAAEAPKMAKFAAAEVVKSRQKGGAMRSTFG